MRPSYRLRNITERTTLANGTVLAAAQHGPSLTQQALGSYAEDFEYVAGSGDLDEHNGRFCITPEYPEGTYAYFATIDADGVSTYPYVIGPTYYGVVATENFPTRGPGAGSTGVTIQESVTSYVPATHVDDVVSTVNAVVYPNPAHDILVVQVATPYHQSIHVELVDMAGRVLRETRINQGSTMCFIDMQTVYAGAYMVRIQHENNSQSIPVVVGE